MPLDNEYNKIHLEIHLNVSCFFYVSRVKLHLDRHLNEGGSTWGFKNP